MDKVLQAREDRARYIEQLIDLFPNKTILTLKLNIPGLHKNLSPFHLVLLKMHQNILNRFSLSIIKTKKIKSIAGDTYVYVLDAKAFFVKQEAIKLEEERAWYRLTDLDVYDGSKWLSRRDFDLPPRKCLLCEREAAICAREKNHSLSALLTQMKKIVISDFTSSLLSDVNRAIISELELYPKAGLVSFVDSGCHKDMDNQTFLLSKDAIGPYIKQFILEGFKKQLNAERLVSIGKQAEKAMFEATKGINTHKGLIFLLGLFLPSFVHALVTNNTKTTLQATIKQLAEEIIGDYFVKLGDSKMISHGDLIYLRHGITGIRGEALLGLPTLFHFPFRDITPIRDRHHQYLIEFMSELDDTTIAYKAGIEALYKVQTDMKEILNCGGYAFHKEKFQMLSDEYKKKNISPGGSADMLVIKLIFEANQYYVID
jgi:holo-ACP synthase/triphosphoribosyl-dephospho-CoA synthase